MDQQSLYLIRQAVNAICKRWRMALFLFLAIFLPVSIGTMLKEPVYTATAKILVTKERVYPEVSPLDRKQEAGTLPNEAVINSEMQIIRSQAVMQRLHNELEAQSEKSEKPFYVPTVTVLGLKVRVTRKPNSNVLELGYSSADPDQAINVVNTLVQVHHRYNIELNQDSGALAFFNKEAGEAKQAYVQADLALERFDATNGLTSIAVEKDAAIRQKAQVEADQRRTEAAIIELTTKVAALEAELEYTPATETTDVDFVPNPVVGYMRQNLSRLEMERERLLGLYTEQHRLVQDIDSEIAALKRQIAQQEDTIIGRKRTAASATRKRLEQELLTSQAELGALEARRALLAQRVADYDANIRVMHTKHYEVMRMRRERTEKKQVYDALQSKLEQLQLSNAMDDAGLSNITVVEAAAGPLKREPDFKTVTLVLAFFAALLLSTGSAVVMEMINPVMNSELDVRHHLGLPVLVEIPLNGNGGVVNGGGKQAAHS